MAAWLRVICELPVNKHQSRLALLLCTTAGMKLLEPECEQQLLPNRRLSKRPYPGELGSKGLSVWGVEDPNIASQGALSARAQELLSAATSELRSPMHK